MFNYFVVRFFFFFFTQPYPQITINYPPLTNCVNPDLIDHSLSIKGNHSPSFQTFKRSKNTILMMDIQFSPFLLSSPKYLFLLFSFLILLLKIWKKTTSSDYDITPKLPPGPTKFPLIGNLHNLVGGLPHHVLAGLAKKYGPLMHLQLGEISTVVVSSAKMAKEILVTHHPCFANRPENQSTRIIWYEQEDMGSAPYSEHWKQMRKICMMELLSIKSVDSFRFIRQDEISRLVESIIQSSSSAGD
ncbi:hypothetical protein ACH5RR_012886 [Cinchona calisaya]|uniref:Cytochrome P450 n=1 Tax=Cinchona calisaya TaxID=153742 RepID=A0ABD3A8V1_9GENT